MPTPLVRMTKTRDKDPTLTAPILSRYYREINKRFNLLKTAIWKYIVTDNRLSPKEYVVSPAPIITMSGIVTSGETYVYEHSAQREEEFMRWLDQMVNDGVLVVERRPEYISPAPTKLWSDVYIQSAYQLGIAQARKDLIAAGAKIPDQGAISFAFHQPFHADRAALLYTRTFNGMKGLTETMKSQMANVLASGMAEGRGIQYIARQLQDRVEKIGKTRAKLIARTEVIRAHNEAAMNEFEALENIVGEEVKVQWWTALDERVRPRHRERHGKIYTRKKALTLIGEPNCRCTLLPWTKKLAEARAKFGISG